MKDITLTSIEAPEQGFIRLIFVNIIFILSLFLSLSLTNILKEEFRGS